MTSSTIKQKFILITGCSTGIGKHLAIRLHKDYSEYNVLATVRQEKDLQALQILGIETYCLDLSQQTSIDKAVNWALEKSNNNIYGLINNGAYGQPGAVEDLPTEILREQFETNVFGTHELTRQILPNMRVNNRGRIIQISSILGLCCLPYRGAYNASKYALEALTDTMRLELKDTNIKVSLIEPGPISSEFRKNGLVKFTQNIDYKNSPHSKHYSTVLARLHSAEEAKFTLPPESLMPAVISALTSDKPYIRKTITVPAHILATLKRLLPSKTLDWLIKNKFKE